MLLIQKLQKLRTKYFIPVIFINIKEFNKLTKTDFDARMKEAEKSFASKTEVSQALDLGDKQRKKENPQAVLSYSFCKSHFKDDGMQNYLVF